MPGICSQWLIQDDCGVWGGNGSTCLSILDNLVPEEYSINNIYPNPFNPITNIEFSLPENAWVEISVYDIHGRQLETLISSFEYLGYYSISWDAREYSSGVYLIVMMSDTFKEVKQVVLMK